MNEKRMKTALTGIARRGIPDDLNLWPNIAGQIERTSRVITLLSRPSLVILIAILLFLSLSGVAYAIGRALAYLPGLGVVDQASPLYMLERPISQTREGITITVNEAISSSDQLFIIFTVEGVPPEKLSYLFLPDSEICLAYPELRFPGGEAVQVFGGTSDQFIGGYKSSYKYSSVPLNASDAALFIPCIQGAIKPGALPENWELPLHLVPASPDVDVDMIPILEFTPTSAPQPTVTPLLPALPNPSPEADPSAVKPQLPEQVPAEENPLSVLQVIDAGDSYILIAAFTPPSRNPREEGMFTIADYALLDGIGQAVDWQPAFDLNLIPYIAAAPGKDVSAIKFSKNFHPPLHLTYRTQYLYSPDSKGSYTFEFDAGLNPQAGQEWELNRNFQLAGHTVTLTKITAGENSLTFNFRTDDPLVESVGMYNQDHIRIEGFTALDFAGNFGLGNWSLTKIYSEIPRGKLQITLSGLYLFGAIEDWSVDWQP